MQLIAAELSGLKVGWVLIRPMPVINEVTPEWLEDRRKGEALREEWDYVTHRVAVKLRTSEKNDM